MLITKKRHEREMAELAKRHEDLHDISVAALKATHAEKEKEFSELMEKMRVWRIRHGWTPPRGSEGYRYYSITTEFTFEMMHHMVGGAPNFARMVAEDLRGRVNMALLALSHLDQEPPRYEEGPQPLPLDFNPNAEISDTEEIP